ncbi:MAG TPA: HD-GYP domain-containing protein [Clostridia bacterium]|nr:HD-GYP domain-containing protein [Clostridia bacterium]
MFKFKGSLLKQFAFFSIIAFFVTGIVLVVVISSHVYTTLEEFIPNAEIKRHVSSLNQLIAAVMFAGLLILYIFLLRIIFAASKTLVQQNKSLQDQNVALEHSYQLLQQTYMDTVTTLSRAVDARDPYTAGHSERVAAISHKIAEKMGFDENRLKKLELSALFHDIGKIGVPDQILLKPEKLDEAEFQKIREHPVIGAKILQKIDFLKDSLPIIRHHHERYDGNGYPDEMKGADIPIESRIISVADTYDAMTSDRPYRKSLSHEKAVSEIIRNAGMQFDPEVVDAFLSVGLTENEKARH